MVMQRVASWPAGNQEFYLVVNEVTVFVYYNKARINRGFDVGKLRRSRACLAAVSYHL